MTEHTVILRVEVAGELVASKTVSGTVSLPNLLQAAAVHLLRDLRAVGYDTTPRAVPELPPGQLPDTFPDEWTTDMGRG